ncbi:MAG: hypothetical protein KAS07_04275, partial [Candidatus Pacebacteria bacterium]|nr:hypothetical protein [Candidatus Paceibacterota bacterium]
MFTITKEVKPEEVGSKAFRLSKMTQAGMRVPMTLVISVLEVQRIIKQQSVSQSILDEINATISFCNGSVAVRSTGDGEDGGKLSWAGQFKSILCVPRERLASAILECANAQVSKSVLAYARQNKAQVPPLALIVQDMVNSEFAGVMFTFDPVTGDNHMVIELVDGHGEALVSGQKPGERISVDLVSREIVLREGESFDLPDNLIDNLVDLGLEGKALFGKDQDMEFAYEKDSGLLYALQSRDITTMQPQKVDLEEIRTKAVSKTALTIEKEISRLEKLGLAATSNVLSDQNIAEILTLNPTPMTLELFNYVFAHGDGAIRTARNEMGYEIGAELDEGFFSFVGGQPRCSIVHDACTYRVRGIPLEDYAVMVEGYLEAMIADPKLANYPEVILYDQDPPLDKLISMFGEEKGSEYRSAYDAFHKNLRVIMKTTNQDCRDRFIPFWREMIDNEENMNVTSVEEHVAQYNRMAEMLRTQACPMFVKTARLGFFAYAELRNMLVDLFGEDGEQYVDVLTSGTKLSFNPNLQFTIELAKLRDGLVTIEGVAKTFGHLSIHELEMGTSRYHENLNMVEMLASRIVGDPMEDYRATARKSKELREYLLEKSGDSASELDRAIEVVRLYLPLREVVKFEYLRAYSLMRKNAIEIERIFGWDEGIVFYLSPQEVFKLDSEHDRLQIVALERRAKHDSYRALFVPPVIFSSDLETIGVMPESDGQHVFRGLGVTNVSTAGEVVVMHTLDDVEALASLRPGCILVTKTTDPAWSPVLSIIGKEGGLITEVGGLLAHGAIYAREVGMAAVLNIPGITE